nr:hypothetical protein [Tanacetum cinerariifolium]
MANLKFCDTHNMVAYLLKIEGSEDTGEVQITATIDRKVKLVSETSIRRHLKLEDSDGPILQGEGSIFLVESHYTPSDEAAFTGVDVRHEGAATTVTSLDTGHGSGNIDKTPSMPHDSPLPRVNTLRSDEGNLKQTKQVYGAAYTKIIMKVKKLEKIVKTGKAIRKENIVASDDEEEFKDPSKQGRSMIEEIDQDATKVHTYTRRRRKTVNTSSDGISTASRIVSTTEESVSTAGMIDKAVRLQEQFNEEERQRIAKVHEVAQTFIEEEWENSRARVKADEELTQRLKAEEKDKTKEKRSKPMTQAQQMTYMSNYIKHMGSYTLKQLKKLSFDEIKELFKEIMRSINDFVPIESEDDKEVPKLAKTRSSKKDAKEEIKHEGSKKQKTREALGSAQEKPVILPCLVSDQDMKSFHYFVGRILALPLYTIPQNSTFSWMATLVSAAVLEGMAPFESRICQVKCSHWQYKFPLPVKVVATARRLEMPLPKVCTATEEKKKKLPVKDRWHDKGADSTKKRKEGSKMKRMSRRQKTDVDLEEEEKLKTFLKIDPDEEGVIDYEIDESGGHGRGEKDP